MTPGARCDAGFVRRVLIVVTIGGLALLLWHLVEVLLLAFGAVLVAVLLRVLAEPIARRTPLSNGWALGAATAALLAVIGIAVWLFGAEPAGRQP
jgi:predicted PurR-regulated permease PerM